MDLDKWIQNRGMREVRNPNYNKGKNGEPEFVMVPDVAPHTTPLINMALEHGRNYYSVDAKIFVVNGYIGNSIVSDYKAI